MPRLKQSVNTVEAKNRLNELITQVNKTKTPIVVEKRGNPVAVVLDYQSYQKNVKQAKMSTNETLWQELNSFHTSLRKKYPQGTGNSTEIIRKIREERSAR